MERTAESLKAEGTRAWQEGDASRAATLYADALALSPSSDVELRAKLHGNLFLCKKKGSAWLVASQHAKHACELLPSWAKAHAYLAEANCKLRRWEAAKVAATNGLACSLDADVRRFLRTRLTEAVQEGSAGYSCCDPDNDMEIMDLLGRYQRGEGEIDAESVMIRKQPAAGCGECNFGFTNFNFLHVAAFQGDGRLVDALAAAGAAIDYPTLPADTHEFKFAGGMSEADGGRRVDIMPAPTGMTPLVIACTVMATHTISELMGQIMAQIPPPDAAIRLVALGADLKQTLTIPSDTQLDMRNCLPFMWRQLGLSGKTALQLAVMSCHEPLIKECIDRGADIAARDIAICPPPVRGRVRDIINRCSPPAPGRLPADVYDCRCGSRLLWSHCHGAGKLIYTDGQAPVHSDRVLLRYSPCALCPCKTKNRSSYYDCCWEGPHAWFGDDITGNVTKVSSMSHIQATMLEEFRRIRLAEGSTPDSPLLPARDEQGRPLGRAMTKEEFKRCRADDIRYGIALAAMAVEFGPKCTVASTWDPEVVAGVVELIDADQGEFLWFDTHWALPIAELHTRVEEWNEALTRYLDGRDLSEHDRREIQTLHTATPFAPCANPTCCSIETQVKQFQMCTGCKRVAYCSSTCQADHWMSGHQQHCICTVDHGVAIDAIDATRMRAHAWRLLADAGDSGPADSSHTSIQRLLAAMELMRKLPAQERSLPFFIQAAKLLTAHARPESLAAAVAELESVLSLCGAETADPILRALEQLRNLGREEERRLCKFCGHSRPREAFSQNQWRRGQRRCIECQQGGVLTTVDQRGCQSAEEAGRAAMAAIFAEGMERERIRIQEELARRNSCERADSECAVCFEVTDVESRYAMPCNLLHWLCKSCLRESIEHAKHSGLASLPCHLCRMPVALMALESILNA